MKRKVFVSMLIAVLFFIGSAAIGESAQVVLGAVNTPNTTACDYEHDMGARFVRPPKGNPDDDEDNEEPKG